MLSQRSWAAILFLNILFVISRTLLCETGKTKHTWIGKDYPVKLPVTIDDVQTTFDCSARYKLNTPIAPEIWNKSTDTRNGGFVRMGPDRRVFAISMFHELHCISALSRALATPAEEQTPMLDGHVAHCLNYLRMLTQCAADATEEPVVRVEALKSEGCAPSFIRKCRNWNTVYDYLSRNYLAFHEHKVVNGTWYLE